MKEAENEKQPQQQLQPKMPIIFLIDSSFLEFAHINKEKERRFCEEANLIHFVGLINEIIIRNRQKH